MYGNVSDYEQWIAKVRELALKRGMKISEEHPRWRQLFKHWVSPALALRLSKDNPLMVEPT